MAEKKQPVILIIDDEPVIRSSIHVYLEYYDYTVLEAKDGRVGLEIYGNHDIDLILVDLRIPEMDGLEVLATVRTINENTPVIVVSGTGKIADVVEALRLGAWDYLLKPINDMSILIHTIEKGLEWGRLRRENQNYQKLLEQKVERKTSELNLVNRRLCEVVESTKRLLGCGELQESGQVILEEFGRHMNAQGGSIYQVTELGLEHLHSLDPGHAASSLPFPLKKNSAFARAMASTEPFFVVDIDREDSLEASGWQHYGDNSILFFPISNRSGQTIAIVALHSKNDPPFIAQDREIGAILSSYASEILQTVKAVADLKRHEELLMQAQKMEAVGALAGGIAHDFNNILSAIIGYTDLSLFAGNLEPNITNNLDQIKKASNRARDLIKQILSFSRTEEFKEMAVDISPTIKEALKLLRAIIPSSIEIKRDIPGDLGKIVTDPTKIHQVLMNLCTNAAQSMKNGEGEIMVRFTRLEKKDFPVDLTEIKGDACLCLSVADNGSGIAQEVMPRIFDPYVTTRQKGEGTGLGLAVVHGIILQSGGAVRVFSEVGQGSVFYLYFPLVEDVREPQENVRLSSMPCGTERILFVDDEVTLAEVAGEMLLKLGYQVETQTSSVEALRLFRENPSHYDLLITDQTMPVLSGIELARETMELRSDLPVILYTGYSTAIDGEEANKIGIKKCLLKPLSMNNLAMAVRKVLDG